MARTVRLFRLEGDGRKLAAGSISASTPTELVAKWQAFLALATHLEALGRGSIRSLRGAERIIQNQRGLRAGP